MTKSEAKKLSLEVWRYLRDHPEIVSKIGLPSGLYVKIQPLIARCPLCEVLDQNCELCPLGDCALGSPFELWSDAVGDDNDDDIRATEAAKIVSLIEAWEVEE